MKLLRSFSLLFFLALIGIFFWMYLSQERGINSQEKNILENIFGDRQEVALENVKELFSGTREEELRELFRQKADYVTENELDGEIYITITDTDNCNTYTNTEYGFSLNFPPRKEGGDTCKVLKRIKFSSNGGIFTKFEFLLPDDPKKGNGLNSNPTGLYGTLLFTVDSGDSIYNTGPIPAFGWYSGFGLEIIDETGYQDPIWENYIGGRKYMEQNIIGNNNQYYFLVWWNPEYRYFDLGYGGSTETDDIANYISIFDRE